MRPSLADARRALSQAVRPLPVEVVPLREAAGRIVRDAIAARVALPPTDCAAVDGYAVRVADLLGSDAKRLRLAGTLTAGLAGPPPLAPGHCMAVMTGAPLPPGTDAVLPLEAVHRDGDAIGVATPPPPGSGIRRAGDEARPGEILVPSGMPADPRVLERLAAQGITQVPVSRRAHVRILVTGDELVPPGAAFLAFAALARPLLRTLSGWDQPVPAFTAHLAEPLGSAGEDARLVLGIVTDAGGRLEFRRRGQGWPALGILGPSAVGQGRDERITVEPLPQGGC